jgi:hypothetical protein
VTLPLHSTQCDVCGVSWFLDCVLEIRFCQNGDFFGMVGLDEKSW